MSVMSRLRLPITIAIMVLLGAISGCASGGRSAGGSPPDPDLEAAVSTLVPALESSFGTKYAGSRIDDGTLVIYRVPDPDLDAFVAERAGRAKVELRAAAYSLSQMKAVADSIIDDRDYWAGRGVSVNGAVPAVDGSGVQVMATGQKADTEALLRQRYPAVPVTIGQDSGPIVPYATVSLPPIEMSAPPSSSRTPEK
ncbi:hypothetical protein AB0J80_08145 [Actinoplanes sp. NPDC049548]|uniref:hypothetical protein n=1 Tax=Actinoplanes sp. NPDC049548 TaxID=3155152 RepID=UPI003440DF3B